MERLPEMIVTADDQWVEMSESLDAVVTSPHSLPETSDDDSPPSPAPSCVSSSSEVSTAGRVGWVGVLEPQSEPELNHALDSGDTVVLFHAPWCRFSQQVLGPFFDAATTMSGQPIGFIAVDTDLMPPGLPNRYGYTVLPTVRRYTNGFRTGEFVGKPDGILAFARGATAEVASAADFCGECPDEPARPNADASQFADLSCPTAEDVVRRVKTRADVEEAQDNAVFHRARADAEVARLDTLETFTRQSRALDRSRIEQEQLTINALSERMWTAAKTDRMYGAAADAWRARSEISKDVDREPETFDAYGRQMRAGIEVDTAAHERAVALSLLDRTTLNLEERWRQVSAEDVDHERTREACNQIKARAAYTQAQIDMTVTQAECQTETLVEQTRCQNQLLVGQTQCQKELAVTNTSCQGQLNIVHTRCQNDLVTTDVACRREVMAADARRQSEALTAEAAHHSTTVVINENDDIALLRLRAAEAQLEATIARHERDAAQYRYEAVVSQWWVRDAEWHIREY
jgi:hypothetical protein